MKSDNDWGSSSFDSEENGLDSMSNLADIMLVFIVGLLVAIFNSNGYDSNTTGLENIEIKEEAPDIPSRASLGSGEGYESMGKVYQDPKSGKFYMVKEKK